METPNEANGGAPHPLHSSPASSDEAAKSGLSSTLRPRKLRGTPAPWTYVLIRWLFRFVLGVFYSDIVVEGEEHITPDGIPCMLTSNHSNSLTDALLLVVSVPSSRRSLLRLTAKDSQFGRGTFTSRLIEASGTLPIKRPKDHLGVKVDNSVVFEQLIGALGKGDAICMFPEGMSRFKSEIAPLRQGVSRILAETLSRKGNEELEIAVQTCSITYLHRNLFRSDVLVTFHPPIFVSRLSHPDLIAPSPSLTSPPSLTAAAEAHESAIRSLTSRIGASIRSGILDAPSWSFLRLANTARRLYAPLGTKLALGDHVRLTQRFVDALGGREAERRWEGGGGEGEGGGEKEGREKLWKTPMVEKKSGEGYFAVEKEEGEREMTEEDLEKLRRDLKIYQDLLYLHGLKDDRIRNPRLLHRRVLLERLGIRIATSFFLFAVALPGLWLWAPAFWLTRRAQKKLVKNGPAWDTYDEIAQTKLAVGLGAGLSTLFTAILLTSPFLPLFNLLLLPSLMWLTLRFLEDLFSSLRALIALFRLLFLGKKQLGLLRELRADLRERVERLAVERAGLPRDAGVFVKERERRWKRLGLGRVEGGVRGWLGFVNPRRRRKKDWNEALKLFDQTEYAEEEEEKENAVTGGPS